MKKIITLMFVCTLAFSACGTKEEMPTVVTDVPTQDAILDAEIFTDAVGRNDAALCDEILESAKKDECREVVAYNNITIAAVTAMDSDLCDDIEQDRFKENCDRKVQYAIDQENEYELRIEEVQERIEANLEIETRAISNQDITICNEMDDSNQRASCKFNIVVNEAYQKGDQKICNKIGEDDFIELCKLEIETNEQ